MSVDQLWKITRAYWLKCTKMQMGDVQIVCNHIIEIIDLKRTIRLRILTLIVQVVNVQDQQIIQ